MRLKDEAKIAIIYQAALELVGREGIAGLTMHKLARRANLATGTLYIYFKNKEALFHSLYRHLYNRTDERFFQGYKPDLPFRDGMKRIWINYLRHRVEHYEESVFLEQYARSPYITPEDKRLSESMKTPFHAIIQRGKLEQLVKADVDDEMILLLLLGFIRELAHEHVGGAYEITQERIDKAFQLSWDAVKQ